MPEELERGAEDPALEVGIAGCSQRGAEGIGQEERAGRIDAPGAPCLIVSSVGYKPSLQTKPPSPGRRIPPAKAGGLWTLPVEASRTPSRVRQAPRIVLILLPA